MGLTASFSGETGCMSLHARSAVVVGAGGEVPFALFIGSLHRARIWIEWSQAMKVLFFWHKKLRNKIIVYCNYLKTQFFASIASCMDVRLAVS